MHTPSNQEFEKEARFDRAMKACLPEGWTYGYIGNVYSDGTDDRSWRIFAPHPGRVGTSDDCLGDFSTANRHQLLGMARAIKFWRDRCAIEENQKRLAPKPGSIRFAFPNG